MNYDLFFKLLLFAKLYRYNNVVLCHVHLKIATCFERYKSDFRAKSDINEEHDCERDYTFLPQTSQVISMHTMLSSVQFILK